MRKTREPSLKCMAKINFRPWVGKNYENGLFNGKKILVLGESHYCINERGEGGRCNQVCSKNLMDEECFNQTINLIEDVKQGWRLRTFSNFERTMFGKVPDKDEREFLWDGVVFYNYLQYAQSGPTRPLEQDTDAYKDSEEAFKEVLETYLPDYIIAWGMRLYDITPNWGGESSLIEIEDNGEANVWTYTIKGKRIPTLFIYHPCYGGYSWSAWHPFIKKFLGLDGIDIPTWLSHKPIVAVDYQKRDAQVGAGDALYLSIGRSTWDNDTVSAKIWRETPSGAWSRQSEDIPLWRLLDLAILFIATIKNKRSVLGEVVVNESDESFLKNLIKKDIDLYNPRIEELIRLLK